MFILSCAYLIYQNKVYFGIYANFTPMHFKTCNEVEQCTYTITNALLYNNTCNWNSGQKSAFPCSQIESVMQDDTVRTCTHTKHEYIFFCSHWRWERSKTKGPFFYLFSSIILNLHRISIPIKIIRYFGWKAN